jgi:carboxypeptidase family protein
MGELRSLALLGSIVLLAACGAGASEAAADGTVTGIVGIRACGGPPPATLQPQCVEHPMAGAELDLMSGGQTVKAATTDADGRYTLSIAPGTYLLRLVHARAGVTGQDARTVKIESGKRVEADFHIIFEAV